MNALRHGLDSAPGVLLPGEDPAEREALARAYRDDLRPQTHEEADLVARMAETAWLERRAHAAAYAAAEDAIAAHGADTDVLAIEACAGGRGPFLRAEQWNLRLTGRLLRLVRQFTRARRTPRDASRSGGTKPLLRDRNGQGVTRPEHRPDVAVNPRNQLIGSGAITRNKAIALPGPKTFESVSELSGAGEQGAEPPSETRNKAIAHPAALSPFRLPTTAATHPMNRNRQAGLPIAGNKAIASTDRPGFPTLQLPATRNKAIAPPQPATQVMARAVGSVVAELVYGRGAIVARTT